MHFSRILSSCCVILLLFTGYSCRNTSATKQDGEKVNIKYAEGFDITRYPDYIRVDLRDPWDTTRLLHRYLLVDKKKDLSQSLPDGTLIRTPVDRMVVYSSVHGSMLDELGIAERIVGVCESEYISVPSIRDGIDSGLITDVGNSFSPDVEKIIDLSPEAILVSPFENCSYGRVEKLNIPIIECADYMENTPLGRAEWIRAHRFIHRSGITSRFAFCSNRKAIYRALPTGIRNKKSSDRHRREKNGIDMVRPRREQLYGTSLCRCRSRLFLERRRTCRLTRPIFRKRFR